MSMVVHMVRVRVMVIVVARSNGVIVVVIVGNNHSTILTWRGAAVAWVTSGIVTIPHVDCLVVGTGIPPGRCSIVNFHLPTNGGRRGLFPASRLHTLVLFADITPARVVLLHRTGTSPRTNTSTSSTTSAAAAAFLWLGGAPATLHWSIGT